MSAIVRPANTHAHDVAIIDLMLPGRNGLSLIEEMRRRGILTPVRSDVRASTSRLP